MMRFCLIVNRASGRGRASRLGTALAHRLREGGASVHLEDSRGVEHSRRLAREFARSAVIVAVGGDGLVRSVAGEVVAAGGTLGIAPSGRGNDFARQLELPTDPEAIARVLLAQSARRVDVIDVAGEVVLGSVYTGVDATVSAMVNRSRYLPPSLVYPVNAIRAILGADPYRYTLTIDDGEPFVFDGFTVVIANSGYYGSGMHIAPSAVVDDGLLDIVVIRAGSRLEFVRALPSVYRGTHIQRGDVIVLRGQSVRVCAGGGALAYADGESLGPLPVFATVRPAALNVLA